MMLRNKMVIKKLFKANKQSPDFNSERSMRSNKLNYNQLQLNRLKDHNLLMKNCEKANCLTTTLWDIISNLGQLKNWNHPSVAYSQFMIHYWCFLQMIFTCFVYFFILYKTF